MASIFPQEISSSLIETTEQEQLTNVILDRGTDFLFDFSKKDFVLKDGKLIEVTGDAAVVFWIEKTIRTEYERATVYQNTNYGTELDRFIGQQLPKEIARLQLEDSFKNSLLQHERINSITNFTFSQEREQVFISFEVELLPITILEDESYGSEEGFTRLSTLEEIQKFLSIRLITADKFLFKTSLGEQVYINV